MRIVLHLGVHKTATTYIQDSLKRSIAKLDAHRIGYVPLEEMRKTVTPNIRRKTAELRSAVAGILARFQGYDTLILSDENIAGGVNDPLQHNALYPNSRGNLERLLENLGGHQIEVYIALRSYDSFLASMYSEVLRHHPFVTFYEYTATLSGDDVSWHPIIQDLTKVVNPSQMILWDFADFRQIGDQIFDSMLGAPLAAELDRPTGSVRDSLSAKAIAALTALRHALSNEEIKLLVGPIGQAFPKNSENLPYLPFPPKVVERLQKQYAIDIARIKADFPAIRFVTKAPVTSPSPA